ncbi:hypothetical protein V1525DRAFT_413365 [Lipomyces kononenkoae]|uniref:Uncharacterized protein n=1 Tax=Lipomyces kononenkoae TaxID=34357 RepID=A0ACC3SSK0_LIPKO
MHALKLSLLLHGLFDYFQRSSFAILLLSETGQPSADEIALWDIELSHRGCRCPFTESAHTGILWKSNANLGEPLARNRFSSTLSEPHQQRCTDVVFRIDDSPTQAHSWGPLLRLLMENVMRTGFGPARGSVHNLARWRWLLSPAQLSRHYHTIFGLARGYLRDGLPLRWYVFLDSWRSLVCTDHFPKASELADLRHLRWTDVALPVPLDWFAMRDHVTITRPSATHLHSIWRQCSTAGIPLAGGTLWAARRLQPALPAAEWATFWLRLSLLYPRDPAAANSFHLFQLG